MSETIVTPEFRVSYPNLFRPGKPMKPTDELKYSMACLFPKDAKLKALRNLRDAKIIETFGSLAAAPKKWNDPLRDQGEKESMGYEEGSVFINVSSKTKPELVDKTGQPIIVEADFYAGCYALAQIKAYWYDKAGNKGVGFGMNSVMKRRDGEPLDGRMRAAEAFKEFMGDDDDDDDDADDEKDSPFKGG